jgi:hypothetical protein
MAEEFPGDDNYAHRAPLPPSSHITLAEVRFDDFAEAQKNPKVAKALKEARAESAELRDAGQIHPGG